MDTFKALLLQVVSESGFPNDKIRKQFEALIPQQLPYKGEGFISVDDDNAAEEILREHVGEDEWRYYPSHEKLIQPQSSRDPIYYGKFEIDNFRIFLMNLLDAGIHVYDFDFHPQNVHGI